MNVNVKLWEYLRKDKKDVNGWLQRVDAEIIGSILTFQDQQDFRGSCVEIGVHHGKSFIPLCMSLKADEQALCIDLFDDQEKNLDSSGKGDFNVFKKNIEKFGFDLSLIRILKGSSEDVRPDDILSQVGQVRFFSVDGGHWESIVRNDLILAEKTLTTEGVIALDDNCRAEWPDVTYGYTLWQNETKSDIVPFASGSNKLYLCRKDYAQKYRAALESPFLSHYFTKSYRTDKSEIDCYRVEAFKQDEESTIRAMLISFSIFRPDIFVTIREWFRKVRK
jgi:hypothetical protein